MVSTQKLIHMRIDTSLVGIPILYWQPPLLLLIPFVVYKRICSMSTCFNLLHPLALIFGEVYLHSCASLTIFQICFFTLSLGTSFDFHLVSSLHRNNLMDLFDLSSLGCVYGKDMICTMCLIYWKTMSMSHTSLLGWASMYLPFLVLVAQHLFVTRLCLLWFF